MIAIDSATAKVSHYDKDNNSFEFNLIGKTGTFPMKIKKGAE